VHELARSAADLLLDSKNQRDRLTFDTRLIDRASTGPVPPK
jgi:DNA-binding LacI/PurR family transcriptional regulator